MIAHSRYIGTGISLQLDPRHGKHDNWHTRYMQIGNIYWQLKTIMGIELVE